MKRLIIVIAIVFSCILISSCNSEKIIEDKLIDFAIKDLQNRLSPSSFIVDSTKTDSYEKPFRPDKNGRDNIVYIYYQTENMYGTLIRCLFVYIINIDTTGNLSILNSTFYRSESEKIIEDKLIDFTVNDLYKKVVSPSSFIVDSTKSRGYRSIYPEENGNDNIVYIYYQSQNRFGALLRGFGVYIIKIDTSGSLLILNSASYSNEKEFDKKYLDACMSLSGSNPTRLGDDFLPAP